MHTALRPLLPLLTVCMLHMPTAAEAQDAAQAEDPGWDTGLNLGLSATEGNSDTLQSHASLRTTRRTEVFEADGRVGGAYGETDEETTTEKAEAGIKLRWLRGRWFVAYTLDALHDGPADVDYRIVTGPGMGRFLLKSDTTRLEAELGVAYIGEETSAGHNDVVALRVAERFEYTFPPAGRLWQSVEFLPESEDIEDFLLKAELGAEAALNARMSLRIVLQNTHDSVPAPDREKNDASLIAGLRLKL